MEPWLLNWTAFVARNTHSVIDGVSYDDGPEWFKAMWKLWLNNSDHGEQLKQNKMTRTTTVFEGDAQWSRKAFLRLENDKVIFDCSDSEYGPIEFPLAQLKEAIQYHEDPEDFSDWDVTLLDGLENE